MNPIIIIGTGMAGYTLAREFRKLDKDSELIIISADAGGSYPKPNLSKALADGKTVEQLVMMDAAKMSATLNARILTETRVDSIDTAAHSISLNGESQAYSKLVLAVGADPIHPQFEGDANDFVLSINDIADYARFREALTDGAHVAIVGAGLIGCEFANDLCSTGHSVTLIGREESPLVHLLPNGSAEPLVTALAAAGVNWQLGCEAQSINQQNHKLLVSLSNGENVEADLVLAAIGLRARITLASEAGLACNRGIQTNRQCQTSAEDVFAIGDCAEVDGHLLPFVMPIMHCARALAKTLYDEPTDVSYPAMPVLVKTPLHPVNAVPPVSTDGEWAVDVTATGARAVFSNKAGEILGFALTGEAVSEKQALLKEIPALL